MRKTKIKVPPKYKVPDEIRSRVRDFMNDFMKEQNLTKSALAELMHEKLGRSGCRPSLVKKFSNATFQLAEVIEILDLFECKLKIVPKSEIEKLDNSKINKE